MAVGGVSDSSWIDIWDAKLFGVGGKSSSICESSCYGLQIDLEEFEVLSIDHFPLRHRDNRFILSQFDDYCAFIKPKGNGIVRSYIDRPHTLHIVIETHF